MVTRRELLQASATIPLATMAAAFAGDPIASLAAAPLAGHFTHDSVRIWLQSSGDAKAVIEYWPNPHMGSTELPGTWCKFTHEDAEFYLLDDRFHRDAEKAAASPEKVMFCPVQMAWLKKSLRDSKTAFKVIANGSQLLSEHDNGSPLTSRLYKLDKRERANPRLVKELVVEARNFGTLEFADRGLSRKLIARCFDSNAKLLWEKTVAGAKMSATGEPA